MKSYSVNLNYLAGRKVNLYIFWTRDDIESELINTSSTLANSWTGLTRDLITTVGLGSVCQHKREIKHRH